MPRVKASTKKEISSLKRDLTRLRKVVKGLEEVVEMCDTAHVTAMAEVIHLRNVQEDTSGHLYAVCTEARQVPHLKARVNELRKSNQSFADDELRNSTFILSQHEEISRLSKQLKKAEEEFEITKNAGGMIAACLLCQGEGPLSMPDVLSVLTNLESLIPGLRLNDEVLTAVSVMLGKGSPVAATLRLKMELENRK
ncbi:MAG: hypothetical protein WAW92_03585 [Minisyncoccia bacterium]